MNDRPAIAIADDEAITRDLLAQALGDRFDVRTFASGQAVLDHRGAHDVGLLLLDVGMPGLSGYETCRALRARPDQADVPVIFVSVHALTEERLLGYAAGGNDYVTKPFDLDELIAKITVAIETGRRTRQLALDAQRMGEAALVTAEMMGEVGVVLEFQRAITGCRDPEALADAALEALGGFGLDGCMRLRQRGSSCTRAASGAVSALESSLLDHLEARPDARIVTLGTNLGFSYGDVTLLVRSLAWTRSPTAPQTVDAMSRARDNVALIVEGALARLKAMADEDDARHLVVAQRLIAATRAALHDLEEAARVVHGDLDAVFETAREDFEYLFPQLGLTSEQEERLTEIVERQRARGLDVVARGRLAERRLQQLLDQMEPAALSPARA